MASTPPTDANGVIKIDFSHFSLKLRSMMVIAMLLGVGGGGWHLIGQAQEIANPSTEIEALKRDHALEMQIVRTMAELDITLAQLRETDKQLSSKIQTLQDRVETLSSLVAANLAATTENNPQARNAAKRAADRVRKDPLSVLAP